MTKIGYHRAGQVSSEKSSHHRLAGREGKMGLAQSDSSAVFSIDGFARHLRMLQNKDTGCWSPVPEAPLKKSARQPTGGSI